MPADRAEDICSLEDLSNPNHLEKRHRRAGPRDGPRIDMPGLGTRGFHQIPDWFHEGTAEIFRNEEEPKIIRAMNRIRVWLAQRTNLPTPGQMCLGDAGDSGEERNWFYLTSAQFARELESRQGPDSLNRNIEDVRDGAGFEQSLTRRLAKTCEELSTDWLESW